MTTPNPGYLGQFKILFEMFYLRRRDKVVKLAPRQYSTLTGNDGSLIFYSIEFKKYTLARYLRRVRRTGMMAPLPEKGVAMSARTAAAGKMKRLPPGVSNPVDIHVGQRLRLRRTLLGMSQEKLGDSVGLTFQQIQKYERGANRIGASRLFMFSRILDVDISYFFDDIPNNLRTYEGQMAAGLSGRPREVLERDPMARRETLELVRAYYSVGDPKVRHCIIDLVGALGHEEE